MPEDEKIVNSTETESASDVSPETKPKAAKPKKVVAMPPAPSDLNNASALLVVAKSRAFDLYVALERAKQEYNAALNDVVAKERGVMIANQKEKADAPTA